MNGEPSHFALDSAPRAEPSLQFRPMIAGDAVLLDLQPSQHFELGLHKPLLNMTEGEDLAENGLAWCAHRGSRILVIAGFRRLYTPHAIAWAALSAAIGADHLAITRFAAAQIADAPFRRIEAIVDAADIAALRWARMVGLVAKCKLEAWGEDSRDHYLFQRVTDG